MNRRKGQYTVKQFMKAIPGSGGVVSTIAMRVGCTWGTADKYLKEHATLTAAYNDEKSKIDDMAVGVVISNIQAGDVTTAKWWLSRKRPDEFGDKQEITHKGGIDFRAMTDQELDDYIDRHG